MVTNETAFVCLLILLKNFLLSTTQVNGGGGSPIPQLIDYIKFEIKIIKDYISFFKWYV